MTFAASETAGDRQALHARIGAVSFSNLYRQRFFRLSIHAVTAVVASLWIGWWALAWFVVNAAVQRIVVPFLSKRHVTPIAESNPAKAERWGAALRALGATVFSLPYALSWAVGGPTAGFFAGMFLCGTVLHGVVYFSNSRLMFAGAVAPPVIVALGLHLLVRPGDLLPQMVLPILLIFALRALWAQRDQISLLESMEDSSNGRKVAEQANLAKSQFLAQMSHELRTPLNAVIGYAEILEEDLGAEGNTTAASDAARIRRSARDLLQLINEVLDLSKIEAGRMEVVPQRVSIPDIVSDVVETTQHIADTNRNVMSVRIDPRVGEMVLDGGELRQCLMNLVSNACKFTKSGKIDIELRLIDLPEGPQIRAIVTDTGVGIAPDEQMRLFQPFVQVDGSHQRKAGGTGLGLVITRRLAQLMGGDVEMESALGRGSCFTLTVNAAWPEAKSSEEVAGAAGCPLILVIEDEVAARDLFRRALARMPLQIMCAADGEAGARLAEQHIPALIVLDIHLPDWSGWDLLTRFRSDPRLRDVPVLVVSIDDDRVRALSLGACDHLVKPVDRDRLAAAVLRFVRLPPPKEIVVPTAAVKAESAA
jgi:signal transduction histidine kinase/ActR/RegA family two-component response regulator